MKFLQKLFLLPVLALSLTLTGCLDIEEEVTYRADGSGKYTLKMDMSQLKGMINMFKSMGGKDEEKKDGIVSDMEPSDKFTKYDALEQAVQEAITSEPLSELEVAEKETPVETSDENNPASEIGNLGNEFAKSLESLRGIKGIRNATPQNDTVNLSFGYSFEFDNIEALNNALHALNKDKFQGKKNPVFIADKKTFERTSAYDLGQLIAQAMSEDDEDAENMDMVKMFFSDMKYKQVYHFDRKIKKSSNTSAEISADGKTVTLIAKPFSDGAKTKSVANSLKLK